MTLVRRCDSFLSEKCWTPQRILSLLSPIAFDSGASESVGWHHGKGRSVNVRS